MEDEQPSDLFAVVLGVAQDGGFPQAGCKKNCCREIWKDKSAQRYVTSIAVVDKVSNQRFLFDCTPDFRDQLQLLDKIAPRDSTPSFDGIFLTHAHIGHYAGLIHLGREVIGAKGVPVYGTKRMGGFLSNNGPWDQLVKLNNIELRTLRIDQPLQLNDRLSVVAFQVPHRDEYSDTVGFKISSNTKTIAYLPDIDKWTKWNRSIESLIAEVDVALLDGSFFANGELPGRDMSQIPHPFIEESIARFANLDLDQRNRIKFTHLNHTNPAIQLDGDPNRNSAARQVHNAGMGLARQGEVIDLNRL